VRAAVDAEGGRVGILGSQLTTHRVLECVVDHQITTLTGKQPHQRELVVLIRLDLELFSVVTIGKQVLIELRHIERPREEVRIAHPDILHEPSEHAIEFIHGSSS
jgi:hypothetical protein